MIAVPTKIAVPGRVVGVAAGFDHSLAVTDRGEVFAWGRNSLGQLGDGTTTDRPQPVAVPLPRRTAVVAVAAGRDISAALTSAGGVLVWGNSAVAALGATGLGQLARPTPVGVAQLPGKAVAIDVGDRHVVALLRDGSLWTWGRNNHGQLGDGITSDRRMPTMVAMPGRQRVTSMTTGGDHVIAVTRGGDIVTWGTSRVGSLATRADAQPQPTVSKALNGAAITAIAAGQFSRVVLVDHGPAVALLLAPASSTVAVRRPQRFVARAVDAFGNVVALPSGRIVVSARGARTFGGFVWSDVPGTYRVTAKLGSLTGRAVLTVVPAPKPGGPHRPGGPGASLSNTSTSSTSERSTR